MTKNAQFEQAILVPAPKSSLLVDSAAVSAARTMIMAGWLLTI
jgi:hypothetical protein